MVTKKEFEELEKVVTDLKETVKGILASQATTNSTLEAILTRLPIQTPALIGSETEKPNGDSSGDRISPVPMLQKMDLPSFNGSEPLVWIARANQYFIVHETPVDQKLQIALIAMSGAAMAWIQLLLRRRPQLDWTHFTQELLERFGDDSAINIYEALITTKQTGSLEDYISCFESRVGQLPDVTDGQYMGFFLGGLKQYLRDQIQDTTLTSYSSAVRAARRVERMSNPSAQGASMPLTSSRLPPSHTSYPSHSLRSAMSQQSVPAASQGSSLDPSTGSSPSKSLAPPHNPSKFRELSREEFKRHINAGTCFRCSGKFSPTHRCPPHTLNVLIAEWEEDNVCSDDPQQETSKLHGSPSLQHQQPSTWTMDGVDGSG